MRFGTAMSLSVMLLWFVFFVLRPAWGRGLIDEMIPVVHVSQLHEGQTRELPLGKLMVLNLRDNTPPGFEWHLESVDGSILDERWFGWRFKAIAPGTATIRMINSNPDDPTLVPEAYEVTIIVK